MKISGRLGPIESLTGSKTGSKPVSESAILFLSYYMVFNPFQGRRESDYNGPPRLVGIRLKLIQKSFAT